MLTRVPATGRPLMASTMRPSTETRGVDTQDATPEQGSHAVSDARPSGSNAMADLKPFKRALPSAGYSSRDWNQAAGPPRPTHHSPLPHEYTTSQGNPCF